jgi:hypothetical protein
MGPYAMRSTSLVIALLIGAAPVFASVAPNITITTPGANSTVSTPFLLEAVAAPCSGQKIVSMGYSIDSGATTVFYAASINTHVTSPTGAHTLHIKSWGKGTVCVTDVPLQVVDPPPPVVTNLAVSKPANDASVTTPFSLVATDTECQSKPVVAMGYSIDTSSNTTIVNGTSINASVASPTGTHTLHVKSWGSGVSCVSNLTIYVSAPLPPGPAIPSSAVVVKSIQDQANWQASYDTGTGSGTATASGALGLVAMPSLSGSALMLSTTYSNYGGERYSANFGADPTPQNFVYDAWVYVAAPTSGIANVEMDLNQVLADGDTVIYEFQCDGWSGTWDYTENAGTPSSPVDKWLHSTQACNPQAWTPNAWHHVQVSYARDASGNVTYKSIWFDGAEQDLNVTVNSDFALGWGSALITNFQVDGFTSTAGSSTVYVDNMTVYRW